MTTQSELELVRECTFVPGSYWTPERAAGAVARMVDVMRSPEMESLMGAIASAAAHGGDPAAASAELAPAPAATGPVLAPGGPVDLAACTVRRGRPEDVPAVAQLVVHGELPPLVIEEFIEGFCLVEHDGALVGCGGLEIYEPECAVLRSVVVHEGARGLHLGRLIAQLLLDDARASGAKDAYLFTMHAAPFWLALGFRDLELAQWPPQLHENWQYLFCTRYPEAAHDVHPMWMRL